MASLPYEIFNEEISEPLFNFRIAPFTTYSSAPDQTSLGIGKKNEIKKISSALAILLEAHTSAYQKYEALWIPFSMRLKSVFSIRCTMR